ncbi:MAG: hypothetical protein LBO20_09155, partial [Bifidobacteriaceae bacterium]|nr:hypothetical protein [Bifidobacteriaceae bacterium]
MRLRAPTSGRCRPRATGLWPAGLAAGLAALGLAGPLAAPAMGASQAPAASGPAGPVVLIGVSALAWDDLSGLTTPRLWAALERGGAAAAVVARSTRVGSCPAEGWLALGAGAVVAEAPADAISDLRTVDPAECAPIRQPDPV